MRAYLILASTSVFGTLKRAIHRYTHVLARLAVFSSTIESATARFAKYASEHHVCDFAHMLAFYGLTARTCGRPFITWYVFMPRNAIRALAHDTHNSIHIAGIVATYSDAHVFFTMIN